MCNKQSSFLKYNSQFKKASNYVSAFLVGILSLFLISCSTEVEPLQTSNVIIHDYPSIAEHIIERDFHELLKFTDHGDPNVASLAWRAIAKSETDDLDAFVNFVIRRNEPGGWFALSVHPLENNHLEQFVNIFEAEGADPGYLCRIFYRQGDTRILQRLLNHQETVVNNPACALAVGGILVREPVSDEVNEQVIELAFKTQNEKIRRNLLYGFYRSDVNRPTVGSAPFNQINRLWLEEGIGENRYADRYLVRISGQRGLAAVMTRKNDKYLASDIQLSIELARAVGQSFLGTTSLVFIDRLLSHNNPAVVVEVLESLRVHDLNNLENKEELLTRIEREITSQTRNYELFVTSLLLLHENDISITPYLRKLEFTIEQNPYLLSLILPLYRSIETNETYFQWLLSKINEPGILSFHAAAALADFASQKNEPMINAQVRSAIRDVVEAGNTSAISRLDVFMEENNGLIHEGDFTWLMNSYTEFVEKGDSRNYRVLGEILENHFPDRFAPGNLQEKSIRTPDWNRLYKMGTAPHWILETTRGTIEIRLDPLSAPFTVSSIDSLTRSGVYDGVPFHRVVRNFVIQGGDFDRKDGFGGPDYRLPTEPSFQSFERGKVGVASSGTDTEGSQFFVMKQWSPHLDGDYTIFGEVVRGMDVVDRIQIGDLVKNAKISIR